MVRKDIVDLIKEVSTVPNIHRLGMTTNGYYLADKAVALKQAGLVSVTVSLHSLRAARFMGVTRRDAHAKVVEGIRAAKEANFERVKINTVVIRGYNDDEILDFAEMAFREGFNVRFIEYMPFDGKKLWDESKVVSGQKSSAKLNPDMILFLWKEKRQEVHQ